MAPPKKVKIEILAAVAGRFGLSYDIGQTYSVEKKQADLLIKTGYAKKV